MKGLIITIALMIVDSNLLFAQETKMLGTGVVFAKDEFKEISVLNIDGSNYVKLIQTSGGEIKVSYSCIKR